MPPKNKDFRLFLWLAFIAIIIISTENFLAKMSCENMRQAGKIIHARIKYLHAIPPDDGTAPPQQQNESYKF